MDAIIHRIVYPTGWRCTSATTLIAIAFRQRSGWPGPEMEVVTLKGIGHGSAWLEPSALAAIQKFVAA